MLKSLVSVVSGSRAHHTPMVLGTLIYNYDMSLKHSLISLCRNLRASAELIPRGTDTRPDWILSLSVNDRDQNV